MKKYILILFLLTALIFSACARNEDDENKPTSIPPAKKTAEPTMMTDVNTNQPNPVVSYFTDFEDGNDGFHAAFADYPRGDEDLYQLQGDVAPIPDIGSMGFLLSSTNQNNDVLMYITKGFETLPNTNYSISLSFDIAVNVPRGTYGTASAQQSENVFIKAGASNVPLAAIVDSENVLRANWDIGNNELSGTEGDVYETIQKHQSDDDKYEIKKIVAGYQVKSSEDGRLYIMIGVDSGVNEQTSVYIDNVVVEITEQ